MKCPFCKTLNTNVKDSRETDGGSVIRRRRECNDCKKRFTTFEKIQFREIVVIKRSGVRRPFDRSKIEKSITTALHKKKTSANEVIEQKIASIISKVFIEIASFKDKEIQTRTIGNIIMQILLEEDQVAYVRFASVYKDFTTIQDFIKFISNIKKVTLK